MTHLTKAPLPNPRRHPYELWYQDAAAAHPDQVYDPTLWYPRLCVITPGSTPRSDGDRTSLLDAMTQLSSSSGTDTVPHAPDRLRVSVHDLFHALYLISDSANPVADLVLFARGDLTDAELQEHLAQRLSGPMPGTTVEISMTGVPSTEATLPILRGDDFGLLAKRYTEGAPIISLDDREASRPVVGVVIDQATGFANRVFCQRKADGTLGTRFHAVWLQDQGTTSSSTAVGTEIGKTDIDAALADAAASPELGDADVYDALGVAPLGTALPRGAAGQRRRATHGTQVAHVAFGADPDDPSDRLSSIPLLGVQLPFSSVERTNGFLHDLYLKSGLNWVWLQGLIWALQNGHGYPRFLFNHSFGTYAGRPDGYDEISADFDRRLNTGELRAVTAAAGNSFHSATHVRLSKGDFADGDVTLDLHVQPDNRASTFLRIWADHNQRAPDQRFPLEFKLQTPDGTLFELNPTGGTGFELDQTYDAMRGDHLLARIYSQVSGPVSLSTKDAEPMRVLTLALPPTADMTGQPTDVPLGKWRLVCSWPDRAYNNKIAFWVERGDTPDGFPQRGRQSYFSHPEYQRYDDLGRLPTQDSPDSPIKRFGTLSAAGGSERVVVTASYRFSDGLVSRFSSASSTLLPTRTLVAAQVPRQPRLASVSEASPARPNTVMSGTATGSVSTAAGTSIAAPWAMRQILYKVLNGRPDPVKDVVASGKFNAAKDSRYRIGEGRIPGVFSMTPDRFTRP